METRSECRRTSKEVFERYETMLYPQDAFEILLVNLVQNEIQTLEIQGQYLSIPQFKDLLEAFALNNSLTELRFNAPHPNYTCEMIDYPEITTFIELLANKTKLKVLEMRNVRFLSSDMRRLTTILSSCVSGLESLALSSIDFSDQSMTVLGNFIRTNSTLLHLDLGANQFENRSSVIHILAEALGQNSSLTSLDLSYTPLNADQMDKLSQGLVKQAKLLHLYLVGCSLKSGSLPFIEPLLRQLKLQTLCLGENELDAKETQNRSTFVFSPSESKWHSILDLYITTMPESFLEAFKACNTLKYLHLGSAFKTFEILVDVFDALPSLTQLETLNLSGNRIGPNLIDQFAYSLPDTRLKTLILDNNPIYDEGIRLLIEALNNHPYLERLYLKNGEITGQGLIALLNYGEKNKTIEQIFINQNKGDKHLTVEGLSLSYPALMNINVEQARILQPILEPNSKMICHPALRNQVFLLNLCNDFHAMFPLYLELYNFTDLNKLHNMLATQAATDSWKNNTITVPSLLLLTIFSCLKFALTNPAKCKVAFEMLGDLGDTLASYLNNPASKSLQLQFSLFSRAEGRTEWSLQPCLIESRSNTPHYCRKN